MQRQSEAFKKGNPSDHIKAVENVENFMKKHGKGQWIYIPEFVEPFKKEFTKKDKGLSSDYKHSYDLAVTTPYDIANPFLYIEVDGEKHSKKNQQKNDGIAGKYVREFLKREIIRLDKVECLGEPNDLKKYLIEKLGKYLK